MADQTIANMISQALGNTGNEFMDFIKGQAQNIKQGGAALGPALGADESQPTPLGRLAGPPLRLGIGALAGERGVQALGLEGMGQPQGQPAAQAPMQGPQLPVQEPQPLQQQPQGPQQAFTPFTPMTAPQLPDPQALAPPNFTAAREALGPAMEAQQIGQGERMTRGFGGGAAGGLAAMQGAPQGRAATTGEVIGGVGAGMAQAMGALHQESRQLEAFAQASNQMRNNQLSSLASAEEAIKAEQNMTTAKMWNDKEAAQMQMEFATGMANMRAGQIIPVADGFADPKTGQVVVTKGQSVADTYQALIFQHQFAQLQTSVTAHILGQKVFKDNIAPSMRPAYMTAIQAASMPRVYEQLLTHMEEAGKGILADDVRRITSSPLGTADEKSQQVAALFLTEIAAMFVENVRADGMGMDLPYGNLFNEPMQLMLELGGAYPIQSGMMPGI